MSRPNKHRRKKTPRGSKAASRKSAGPGRKKKKANPASAAKPAKPGKVSQALLLRLAKQLARQQAARSTIARAAAAKLKFPIPPSGPQPASGNGAPPAHQQPAAVIRSDTPSSPAPSTAPRRGPNGGDYHTRYHIAIYGSLKADGSHLLIINHKTRIKINWLQFILLLILASHARSKAGLDSPIDLRGGDYLQPSRIEEIITQLKAGALRCAGRQLPECQNAYGADLLRNAKWELRRRVKARLKNPNLLDRGDGAGYRISTPPARIKITLVIEGEHDLAYDWLE